MAQEDKILDNLTRQIVRLRDRYSDCIICGRPLFNCVTNNCHYMKRSNLSVRWNLLNCNLGHEICNNTEEFDSGLMNAHRINLIAKIGLEKVEELERLSKSTCKLSKSEKLALIKAYKNILNDFQ